MTVPMATSKSATLKKVAKMMRDWDFCMLTTQTSDGELRARPMSNNGEVEFDGDVWFFSGSDTRKVSDIEAEPHVQLSYTDTEEFRFLSMAGSAKIVRDADKKRELWIEELRRWFEDGPESDDVVLIKVTPSVVEYWNGEDQGELKLD